MSEGQRRTDHPAHGRDRGLSRRTLLGALAAGGAIAASGPLRAAFAAEGMRTRKIPSSGEALPVMGLGTADAFNVPPGPGRDPLRAVLRRFGELGGRVVDTSPTYGYAEDAVGALGADLGLLGRPVDPLFLATKVHERGREAGIEQMQRSERTLRRTPLDLIQVHNLVDVQTQLDTLRRWKESGRIRYLGITHYYTGAFGALERLLRSERLDFVQFNYSVTTPDAERRLLPLAAERGVAVLVNRPFEDGRLFRATRGRPLPSWAAEFDCASWAQFALKYVIAHPAVTAAIPATSNPRHLEDNMQAGRGRLPDQSLRRRMRQVAGAL